MVSEPCRTASDRDHGTLAEAINKSRFPEVNMAIRIMTMDDYDGVYELWFVNETKANVEAVVVISREGSRP